MPDVFLKTGCRYAILLDDFYRILCSVKQGFEEGIVWVTVVKRYGCHLTLRLFWDLRLPVLSY